MTQRFLQTIRASATRAVQAGDTGQFPDKPGDKPDRNLWVDAAKGLCIILVVLFHSTLGVEKDLGVTTWMSTVIAWARPFRMPDFFMISGLFLSARIALPWAKYLDAKVWHFAYFYLLWFHIHFGLRLKALIGEAGFDGAVWQYFQAYIDPFGSLWFIYLLAVFCVVAKLVHRQPVWLVTAVSLAAHVLMPHTQVFLVDEFFSRFVFFYVGYAYAPQILGYANQLRRLPLLFLCSVLGLWAVFNTLGLVTGLASLPVIELVFAGLGIAAVILFSVLITWHGQGEGGSRGTALGHALIYCGRNSIVIYLAFTIFMAATRVILVKLNLSLNLGLDGGLLALLAATAGLSGALLLHAAVRHTWLNFLFVRPAALHLGTSAKFAAKPASDMLAVRP
jgi:uncharacterized membrane protein YcfT